ncbi:Short-chain dehydrogenase/reductase SDR [Fusarium oxysporum f. sp. vasinfectum]|nr:putative oxidoreductase [Fusarium oxysporum f. sp. conglutinans]KAJ4053970.1 hypothetical protein NW763_007520 [Fusarium oxysporum]KAK2670514.1 Short-chain dehydrogenase/reductase SDR [Fusarium oxysporum f. sp. vasinfectum]KAK2691640.1 hypothetical protein QWA68_007668 [Fusarium oxysporum]KAK2926960.1 Short-chain dehydrogenase/reductase SDR [Fusarium oxysporum f. sp. vasinfectum]
MAAKTVLITGGGNGIGLATVKKRLASAKVTHLLIIDIGVSNLTPLAQQYPRKLHIACGNETKQSDSLKAVNTLIEKAGSISDLILNAGTFKPVGQLPTITIEAWKATFDVTFLFYCRHEELPPSKVDFMKKLSGSGNLLHRDQPASGFLKLVETGIREAMNGKTLYWEDIVNGYVF